MSGNHHVDQCRHGRVVSQCRCPAKDKAVRVVPCPPSCAAITPTPGDWPAHLRDDAPAQRCNRCGRETVATSEFGREDRMTQPDGNPCGGRFQ